MKKQASTSTSGFTFLEVMMSVLIITVGMLGAMGLSSYILRSSNWSDQLAASNMAAQDKLEELRDVGYLLLADGSDTAGTFKRSWTIADLEDGKEISMRVVWHGLDGIGHSTELKTFLSDPRKSNGFVTFDVGVGSSGSGGSGGGDALSDVDVQYR